MAWGGQGKEPPPFSQPLQQVQEALISWQVLNQTNTSLLVPRRTLAFIICQAKLSDNRLLLCPKQLTLHMACLAPLCIHLEMTVCRAVLHRRVFYFGGHPSQMRNTPDMHGSENGHLGAGLLHLEVTGLDKGARCGEAGPRQTTTRGLTRLPAPANDSGLHTTGGAGGGARGPPRGVA